MKATQKTLKRRQLRSAALFTVSRILKKKPRLADSIHTPPEQTLLLNNKLEESTRDAVAELLHASSTISAPGRALKQRNERWWRDRLKQAKQEFDARTGIMRNLLFEDCVKEAREE